MDSFRCSVVLTCLQEKTGTGFCPDGVPPFLPFPWFYLSGGSLQKLLFHLILKIHESCDAPFYVLLSVMSSPSYLFLRWNLYSLFNLSKISKATGHTSTASRTLYRLHRRLADRYKDTFCNYPACIYLIYRNHPPEENHRDNALWHNSLLVFLLSGKSGENPPHSYSNRQHPFPDLPLEWILHTFYNNFHTDCNHNLQIIPCSAVQTGGLISSHLRGNFLYSLVKPVEKTH